MSKMLAAPSELVRTGWNRLAAPSELVRTGWNRLAARRALAGHGTWCDWTDRLDKIGNDRGFLKKLAAHDVRYVVREDVGDGYSHWVNPLFAFIAPRADLLKAGQDELRRVLQRDLLPEPAWEAGTRLGHFSAKATQWPLFTPAFDNDTARAGVRLLMADGGYGAAELAVALTTQRPDLAAAARQGFEEGIPGFFMYTAMRMNYPGMIDTLSAVPELRAALEQHPAAARTGGTLVTLDDGTRAPMLVEVERDRYVSLQVGLRHPEKVPASFALGQWLRCAASPERDSCVVGVFSSLAQLARRPDENVSRLASAELAVAGRIYGRYGAELPRESQRRIHAALGTRP